MQVSGRDLAKKTITTWLRSGQGTVDDLRVSQPGVVNALETKATIDARDALSEEELDRVDDLFMEASDLKGSDLAAFLAEVEDSRLLEALKRLLEAYGRFDRGFEQTRVFTAPRSELPRQLGSYTVLSKVGEGGMGSVYRAVQEETGLTVALKLVKGHLVSDHFRERFQSEYRVLARMSHSHIARLLEAGVTPEGDTFFAMEFVDGLPIVAFCEENALSLDARLRLFLQVCDAMAHAHQRGVIHRDLKPSNIMARMEEGGPDVKIIDFGIARQTGMDEQQATQTRTGMIVGTPLYMSPEQMVGGHDVDVRSDVYSLGVVLYQVLTNMSPYDMDTLESRPLDEIMQTLRTRDPIRPSLRLANAASSNAGKQWAGRLRGDLDWVVMKAMDKDPERRYQTVFDLKTDLMNVLDGHPVMARPPSFTYRANKLIARNKIRFILAALALSALLFGMGAFVAGAVRTAKAHKETQQALRQYQTVNGFLQNMLAAADPYERGRDTKVIDLLEEAEHELATLIRIGKDPLLPANIMETLGTTWCGIGDYQKAQTHFEHALQLRLQHQGALHRETLKADSLVNWVKMKRGLYREARTDLEEILENQADTLGKQHADTLTTLEFLGSTLQGLGEARKAGKYYQKAVEGKAALYGEEHPETLSSLMGLATANFYQKKYKTAGMLYRRILEAREADLGRSHPRTITTLYNLAYCLRVEGKVREALALYREVVEGRRTALGADHSLTIGANYGLARCLIDKEQWSEASVLLEQILDQRQRIEGRTHARTLRTGNLLAVTYSDLGRFVDAIRILEVQLEDCRIEKRLHDVQAFKSANNLADLLVNLEQPERAHRVLAGMLPLPDASIRKRSRGDLIFLINLALVRERLEMDDPAQTWLQLFDEARKVYGDDPLAGGYLNRCAEALIRLKHYEEAELMLLSPFRALEGERLETSEGKKISEALVSLYMAWNKPELARAYK